MADSSKRVRYFDGQLLQEQDFTAEQAYHVDRQRRHNRQLHTYGIADGLTVTADVGATLVTVSSGTAIDGEGRMIVLNASRTVPIGSLTGSVLVVISYEEQASDPATAGDEGDTRWLERPDVDVIAEADAPDAGLRIRLARLQIAANGTIAQHDETVRTSAGKLGVGTLKVQDPLGASVQFIQDQNGNKTPLAIGTAKVEVSSKAPGIGFSVTGDKSYTAMAELKSAGNEASIRYEDNDGVSWHVGTGGNGGPKNFFFWNDEKYVVTTITPQGTLTAKGLKADADAPGIAFHVDGDASNSPIAELKSAGNEASIRYQDNDGVSWHVGTGGYGGAENFFFWNDEKYVVATLTPEGVLTAKGLKADTDVPGIAFHVDGDASNSPIAELKSAGNEASIRYQDNDGVSWHVGTGGHGGAENFFFWNDRRHIVATITPAGDVLVAGTVDGRDIAADGVKLDTHTGSTNNPHNTTAAQVGAVTGVGGVSNPGGNIGLIGEAGITVTGDNNTKTIKISNTPGGLTTQSSIGPSAQFVRDQSGNQSSLSISTGNVGVGTKTPGFVFTVAGDIAEWPLAEVHNVNNEASVRFLNLNDNLPWHVGSGGQAGKENFFFWNQSQGVVAKITPGGVLSVKGIQVRTEAAGIVFTVEGKNGTAPVAEVKSGDNEASVRYSCTDPVAWHVGLGGHGGAGNFFFWNDSAKGVVATLQKDGTLTVNGGLNVKTLATVSSAPDQGRLKLLKIDPLTGQIYRDN